MENISIFVVLIKKTVLNIYGFIFKYKLMEIISIFVVFRTDLNKLDKMVLEWKASEPPLKIAQFPDLKQSAETSAVTFGLLS